MKEQRYIKIKDKKERLNFLEILHNNGYSFDNYTKEDIVISIFPIVVNLKNKTICMIGNVTCAAAASTQNVLEDINSFFCNRAKWYINELLQDEKIVQDVQIYTIEDIHNNYDIIPNEHGVYFIFNLGNTEIKFSNNIGNIRNEYRGKSLLYDTDKLQNKYNNGDKTILYIGKADGKKGLKQRLTDYIEYGYCKNKAHRGGRAIWQINNNKQLGVCWIKNINAKALETKLIAKYKDYYKVFPIANWRK